MPPPNYRGRRRDDPNRRKAEVGAIQSMLFLMTDMPKLAFSKFSMADERPELTLNYLVAQILVALESVEENKYPLRIADPDYYWAALVGYSDGKATKLVLTVSTDIEDKLETIASALTPLLPGTIETNALYRTIAISLT